MNIYTYVNTETWETYRKIGACEKDVKKDLPKGVQLITIHDKNFNLKKDLRKGVTIVNL